MVVWRSIAEEGLGGGEADIVAEVAALKHGGVETSDQVGKDGTTRSTPYSKEMKKSEVVVSVKLGCLTTACKSVKLIT